ncbi:MAG: hypothetical protein HQL56_08460 [Magnetococcales bacterium]|nr:hypothetical protein [Magnetococcales bacterium]
MMWQVMRLIIQKCKQVSKSRDLLIFIGLVAAFLFVLGSLSNSKLIIKLWSIDYYKEGGGAFVVIVFAIFVLTVIVLYLVKARQKENIQNEDFQGREPDRQVVFDITRETKAQLVSALVRNVDQGMLGRGCIKLALSNFELDLYGATFLCDAIGDASDELCRMYNIKIPDDPESFDKEKSVIICLNTTIESIMVNFRGGKRTRIGLFEVTGFLQQNGCGGDNACRIEKVRQGTYRKQQQRN